MQSGRPISFHDRNIYFGGDLNSLKANYSGDTNQPVFDISGFYFHDAAVQTNGVDDPALQRARSAHPARQQHPLLPVTHARTARPRLEPVGHLVREAAALQQPRARAVPRRAAERLQQAVFNNPNTDPMNAEFGKVTSQANLPRDIQLAFKLIFSGVRASAVTGAKFLECVQCIVPKVPRVPRVPRVLRVLRVWVPSVRRTVGTHEHCTHSIRTVRTIGTLFLCGPAVAF